jgi:small subunit ribosomal protein S20
VANNPSAEKKNRQRLRRHDRNRTVMGSMRTAVKKARAADDAKQPGAAALLKAAVKLIDKAASKGVIKAQTASRSISRLTKALARGSA